MAFAAIGRLVADAIAQRVFPGAVIEVGTSAEVAWREASGHVTYEPGAPAVAEESIFDLASLTKVLVTTPLLAVRVHEGAVALDSPLSQHVSTWRGTDRQSVTVQDALAHCTGLPAYKPLYRALSGTRDYVEAIGTMPLAYAPRSTSQYSDLGFILLGVMLEGQDALPSLCTQLFERMETSPYLQYLPPPTWRSRVVPTEIDPWRGRLLVGEVHDENAAALGGCAGHAGLFGTAAAVGLCARHWLRVLGGRPGAFGQSTATQFVTRDDRVPGSSRVLGWDTMRPTSSCGTQLSAQAFGHVGFTGTSLWVDPTRDLYVVALTNRVHPTRSGSGMTRFRRALHDAAATAWDQRS